MTPTKKTFTKRKFSGFFEVPQSNTSATGITAWSYSRWAKWDTCPRSAYYQYVKKLGDGGPSPQMQRGIDAHEECAAIYAGYPPKGKGSILTNDWANKLVMQKMQHGADLEGEVQLAYSSAWERRKWFDKDVAFRCAFDGFLYSDKRPDHVIVYEHKTGKVRDYVMQAELYACVAHMIVPTAKHVEVNIQYLDLPVSREPTTHLWLEPTLTAGQGGKPLMTKWINRATAMMADREFPMRAGVHCRYCQYRGENGGPCEIWS